MPATESDEIVRIGSGKLLAAVTSRQATRITVTALAILEAEVGKRMSESQGGECTHAPIGTGAASFDAVFPQLLILRFSLPSDVRENEQPH
jgi:hypothetical protein